MLLKTKAALLIFGLLFAGAFGVFSLAPGTLMPQCPEGHIGMVPPLVVNSFFSSCIAYVILSCLLKWLYSIRL
jgi:hypothetical protein